MTKHDTDAQVGSFLRVIALDILPLLSILILALLTTIPIGFPGTIRMGGFLPLIGIIYWTLVRRKAVPTMIVFFMGFFTDIVTFAPFGLHAFIFILLQSILKKQRRFLMGQGFWMMWAAFALIAAVFYLMLCGFQFLFTGATVPIRDTMIAATTGWACIPLVLWLLSRLHNFIDLFDEPIA